MSESPVSPEHRAPAEQSAPVPQPKQLPATAAETSEENPWPLALLAHKLKGWIERSSPTWVEAQLIEVNRRGQNTFFTLRDVDEEISFSASAWGNRVKTSDAGLTPGARVVAHIKPQLWLKTGRLSMDVGSMKPVGLGDLLARLEQLRHSLAAEGLFHPSLKKQLPALPHRIGLITGRNSDAEKDVLRNAQLRWPQVRFEIRNVAVQGAKAVAEVTAALADLDAREDVDVIIIARGGGSLEDLLPFSDERLVRAVSVVQTPVVSAIGHEADHPILDDVADLRASTPTDAAKRVVPDVAEEQQQLENSRARMRQILTQTISREQERILSLRQRPVMARPEVVFDQHAQQIAQAQDRLRRSFHTYLERHRSQVRAQLGRVRALSPQKTLERGYAVLQHEGSVITDPSLLSAGSAVNVLLAQGRVDATVDSVHSRFPSEGTPDSTDETPSALAGDRTETE